MSSKHKRGAAPIVFGLAVFALELGLWLGVAQPKVPVDPRLHPDRPLRELWIEGELSALQTYDAPETAEILVIGDSRVLAGIDTPKFSANGFPRAAVLSRDQGRIVDLIALAERYPARRYIVALSPLSIWNNAKRDERDERHPEPSWTRRVDRRLGLFSADVSRNLLHKIDPKVWHRSWFPTTRPEVSDGAYRTRLLNNSADKRRAALTGVIDSIADLSERGVDVVCVRLPVSQSLTEIEEEGLSRELIRRACNRAGLPLLDYSVEPEETTDGSHLSHAGRERFMRQLLADLADATDWNQ